ncbi:hypothetical protein [Actinokineospora bangkokensis]|uniref:Peptidase M11 gametolysin domain-containing protein n=1 Tax=Actinokineospora bangkokensis TaxID=1193682 RepID=A0A1Q9LPW6_9PSEU|nr:hypothetical protein [Actinokineospora bangkokensis]OLR94034.1 hypothetical protein BJP25_13745 [Actinokineospora bangkokensis]
MPRTRAALIALFAALLAFGVLTPPAQAVPVRGQTGWSVLLCKFSDRAAEPQAPAFFRNFLTQDGAGLGGVADYFADQSAGKVTLTGSVVRGWYTMAFTLAQEQGKSRGQRIQDCVDTAAANGYAVPSGHRTVAILNDYVDSGAAGGRVLLDPGAWNVGFAAHEMLHGYGLGHSFSNDTTYQNASWSQPGEYDDPWDQMSAMNIHAFGTTNFGTSAVGLNGYFRDKLGWLPSNRVLTLGADGVGSRTVTLAPLETPGAGSGPLVVRIPFNPNDLHNYYTVEYRRKTGWSAGIPADIVLIHEVRGGTPYLLRATPAAGRAPVQSLSANGVTITLGAKTATGAAVTITSDITTRCVSGYVWREARSTDKVCVTPATRSQVAYDNSVAASRWTNGAYGPHTCVSGYVWREAFSGDDVCVTTAQRTQASSDNAAHASRVNPARLVFGPNTCVSGYTWREADLSDYVCVTPATRSQVSADNSAAASRWTNGAYGPHTCVSGYVWREAFPGDDVCVTTAQRSQAAADNAAAPGRVAVP